MKNFYLLVCLTLFSTIVVTAILVIINDTGGWKWDMFSKRMPNNSNASAKWYQVGINKKGPNHIGGYTFWHTITYSGLNAVLCEVKPDVYYDVELNEVVFLKTTNFVKEAGPIYMLSEGVKLAAAYGILKTGNPDNLKKIDINLETKTLRVGFYSKAGSIFNHASFILGVLSIIDLFKLGIGCGSVITRVMSLYCDARSTISVCRFFKNNVILEEIADDRPWREFGKLKADLWQQEIEVYDDKKRGFPSNGVTKKIYVSFFKNFTEEVGIEYYGDSGRLPNK